MIHQRLLNVVAASKHIIEHRAGTLKAMSWLFSIVRQSKTAYHCCKGKVVPPIQPYSSLIRFVEPYNTQEEISARRRLR